MSDATANALLRWCKFNAVGAVGMAVKLEALAIFDHLALGHYLTDSAAAVELTLLHNFVWHLYYTWRDRRGCTAIFTQLRRFHLANGAVSMLGNLALMRILVHNVHLRILIANTIAIFCCSCVNFLLSDRWAFAVRIVTTPAPSLR